MFNSKNNVVGFMVILTLFNREVISIEKDAFMSLADCKYLSYTYKSFSRHTTIDLPKNLIYA